MLSGQIKWRGALHIHSSANDLCPICCSIANPALAMAAPASDPPQSSSPGTRPPSVFARGNLGRCHTMFTKISPACSNDVRDHRIPTLKNQKSSPRRGRTRRIYGIISHSSLSYIVPCCLVSSSSKLAPRLIPHSSATLYPPAPPSHPALATGLPVDTNVDIADPVPYAVQLL